MLLLAAEKSTHIQQFGNTFVATNPCPAAFVLTGDQDGSAEEASSPNMKCACERLCCKEGFKNLELFKIDRHYLYAHVECSVMF
jgi:hypothetical protein